MSRYDFDRYEKIYKNTYPLRTENRYYIFDKLSGRAVKIATVYDVADAEMICSALNKDATSHEASSSCDRVSDLRPD